MTIEQFVEPSFRVLIGYLLFMRWACGRFFHVRKSGANGAAVEPVIRPTLRTSNRVIWLVVGAPLLAYLVAPTIFRDLDELPDTLRWIFVPLAVIALVLFLWSKQIESGVATTTSYAEQLRERAKRLPYAVIRHPVQLSDAVLIVALAGISSRGYVGVFALGAIMYQYCVLIPDLDAQLKNALGDDFDSYAANSGAMLPRLPGPKKSTYQVPKRFSLSAVIALMTGLCVIFAMLNVYVKEVPIAQEVYLFVVVQVLGVCLAQMFFGSVPRLISVVAGALLLPSFMMLQFYLHSGARRVHIGVAWVVTCAILGAIVGYLIGAVAAGFFLVLDWIHYLVSRRKSP